MANKDTGNAAETAAAQHLERSGYTIVARNFRTPRCEIDIIAKKGNCLYFVEVKYRQSDRQGSGLDYITHAKRHHMERAAELWLQANRWHGEVTLSAIEVTADYAVGEFIESIY